MPQTFTPSGGVGTSLTENTDAEATGTAGQDMRTNLRTLANKARFLADAGQLYGETPIAPTLLNSWVNSGGSEETAAYWLGRDGVVRLRGSIKSGTIGANAFVLPVGYRPPKVLRFAIMSNNAFGYVSIDTSGGVVVQVGSNVEVHLDGIAFRVDA